MLHTDFMEPLELYDFRLLKILIELNVFKVIYHFGIYKVVQVIPLL